MVVRFRTLVFVSNFRIEMNLVHLRPLKRPEDESTFGTLWDSSEGTTDYRDYFCVGGRTQSRGFLTVIYLSYPWEHQ